MDRLLECHKKMRQGDEEGEEKSARSNDNPPPAPPAPAPLLLLLLLLLLDMTDPVCPDHTTLHYTRPAWLPLNLSLI